VYQIGTTSRVCSPDGFAAGLNPALGVGPLDEMFEQAYFGKVWEEN